MKKKKSLKKTKTKIMLTKLKLQKTIKTACQNGNRKTINHYKIIQINASNSCFNTNPQKLKTTINENQSQRKILSKANVDLEDEEKLEEREDKFTEFNYKVKKVKDHPKARISIIVHKNITYTRLNQYEDDENASIAIKIKEGKGRWIGLYGIHRQWKIPGEGNAFRKEGINKQVARLKKQVTNLNKFCTEMKKHVICGDINIDRNVNNDPLKRNDCPYLGTIYLR